MKIAIFGGAGIQARAIIDDLLKQDDVDEIKVVDQKLGPIENAYSMRKSMPRKLTPLACEIPRGFYRHIDVWEEMEDVDVVISCLPYEFNFQLAQIAIKNGSHFCDLGGNNDIVAKQLRLDKKARNRGVSIIPDCGLAPGLVSLVVAHAVTYFDRLVTVEIRVGGIPQERDGVLNYSLYFSAHGLINEYAEDALVLNNGRIGRVPSLTGTEVILFPEVCDEPFECFTTSGGISTLPYTYKGNVISMNYKTIRWPGHAKVMKGVKEMGLMDAPHRKTLEDIIQKSLNTNKPDMILMRVSCCGTKNNSVRTRNYEMIEYPKGEFTAMQSCTGIPASIIALMQGRGEVKPGAHPQERCIDPVEFLFQLEKRRLSVKIKD